MEEFSEFFISSKASFVVIKQDPEVSGLDWNIDPGTVITNVIRCCEECNCLFSTEKNDDGLWDIGPFAPWELIPINHDALNLLGHMGMLC